MSLACRLLFLIFVIISITNANLIHVAANAGNIEDLKKLIEEGVDLNEPTTVGGHMARHDGATALQLAIHNDQNEAAQLLIEAGADLNARRKDGWTALHYAAIKGNEEITRLLIAKGANPDPTMTSAGTVTPLHFAANKGFTGVVAALLEAGADPKKFKEQKLTAMHDAAYNGHFLIVKMLLDKGADPLAYSEVETTPFHLAVYFNHMDMVKLMLQKGVNARAKRNEGNEALHESAGNNYVDMMKLLIKHGADVNVKNDYGTTPLVAAVANAQYDAIQLLLENGAEDPEAIAKARSLKDQKALDMLTALEEGINAWKAKECAIWLSRIGLKKYRDLIYKKEIDGIFLKTADDDEFKEAGITDAKDIQRIISHRHTLPESSWNPFAKWFKTEL